MIFTNQSTCKELASRKEKLRFIIFKKCRYKVASNRCMYEYALDKCMYLHNFRKSNHSQRTCKQLKNKTKTKVCILEKLMRGGLSSRSSIIPWGMPQQRGGIRPTSCVTPRRVPRKKDTPNNSAKQYLSMIPSQNLIPQPFLLSKNVARNCCEILQSHNHSYQARMLVGMVVGFLGFSNT